jgi:menaquinone-9 beta-reductase
MTAHQISFTHDIHSIDLLIIGAGPAGISTALHLLNLDPSWSQRMVIIEKQSHPRPKLCGGGLTAYGLNILQDLGFCLPLPLHQARVEDIRLHYKNRIIHGLGSPVFIVYRREELDAHLAQEAYRRGVKIHQDEAVKSIEIVENGVLVKTDQSCYLAKAVVGADGSKGITRRIAGGKPRGPGRVGRTLEVIVPSNEDAAPFVEKYALLDFDSVQSGLQGYCWIFPSRIEGKPYYNLGVYDSGFIRTSEKAHLPEELNKTVNAVPGGGDSDRPEGHPIHWFHPLNRFSAPRLLLVGDAAGADPLLGEGIGPALGYGKAAAETLQEAFKNDNYTFKKYKRNILLSPLGRYLMIRWYIAWWSYRLCRQDWFMHTLWTCCMVAAIILPRPKIRDITKPFIEGENR